MRTVKEFARIVALQENNTCPGCGGLDGDHDRDCDYEDENT